MLAFACLAIAAVASAAPAPNAQVAESIAFGRSTTLMAPPGLCVVTPIRERTPACSDVSPEALRKITAKSWASAVFAAVRLGGHGPVTTTVAACPPLKNPVSRDRAPAWLRAMGTAFKEDRDGSLEAFGANRIVSVGEVESVNPPVIRLSVQSDENTQHIAVVQGLEDCWMITAQGPRHMDRELLGLRDEMLTTIRVRPYPEQAGWGSSFAFALGISVVGSVIFFAIVLLLRRSRSKET